jgi:hypothetical protein
VIVKTSVKELLQKIDSFDSQRNYRRGRYAAPRPEELRLWFKR